MKITKRVIKISDGSYAEIWHKEDDKNYHHREDGPAFIVYYKDGSIRCEEYFINNQRRRLDGPAAIRYNMDGSIDYEEYFINGVEYDYKDWKKHKLVRDYIINRILENELDYENC